jgi:hypothetical protein
MLAYFGEALESLFKGICNMDICLNSISFISPDKNCYKKISTSQMSIDSESVIKLIPMLQRRRLTTAGRYAVGLTLKYLSDATNNIDKIIFTSRTGETLRCLKLLTNVFDDEAESPAEFSSIVAGFTGETIAIAAGSNTISAGLTEAYISLNSQNKNTVLLVYYEENIADQKYMHFKSSDFFNGPYACALLLTQADIDGNEYLTRIDKCFLEKFDSFEKMQALLD